MGIQRIEDLKVYEKAFELGMEVFRISRHFPPDEKYSLTAQIVRSSRSVAANIREGYAKKKYNQIFIRHLMDALGSCEETRTWLDFALECQYLAKEAHQKLDKQYASLSAMIFSLQKNWKPR